MTLPCYIVMESRCLYSITIIVVEAYTFVGLFLVGCIHTSTRNANVSSYANYRSNRSDIHICIVMFVLMNG